MSLSFGKNFFFHRTASNVGVGSQSSLLTLTSRTLTDLTEVLSCLVFSWQAAQEWPFFSHFGQILSLARQYFSGFKGLPFWSRRSLRVYPHGDPPQVLHFSDEEFAMRIIISCFVAVVVEFGFLVLGL